MKLHGTVQNGMIVIDTQHSLPEGTRVTIVVESKKQNDLVALSDRLLKLAGTVDDLPTDMSRNHDHYIHGTPKQ